MRVAARFTGRNASGAPLANSGQIDQNGDMKKARSRSSRHTGNRWPLQDAKARLSELVREAQRRGPQRVTLHGRDAAVILSADEFARLQKPRSGRDLVVALAASPLAEVTIERVSVKSPVRDIDL